MKAIIRAIARQGPMLAVSALALGTLVLFPVSGEDRFDPTGVVRYKTARVVWFATIGYYIDRAMTPYARPSDMIEEYKQLLGAENRAEAAESFRVAMMRRAVIVAAAIVGGTLGL